MTAICINGLGGCSGYALIEDFRALGPLPPPGSEPTPEQSGAGTMVPSSLHTCEAGSDAFDLESAQMLGEEHGRRNDANCR